MPKLSDLVVRKTAPTDKPQKLTDGDGLYLLISTKGGKLWRYDYRFLDKRKTLSYGEYPEITLARAREKHAEARRLLAEGIDPSAAKKEARQAQLYAAANSFEAVALEWHSKQTSRWSDDHAGRIKQRLIDNLFPILGKRPIESLKTRDLLEPLRKTEERDALDLAKRLRQYITAIMRYAVQTGRIATNPGLDLQGAIATRKQTHRPALPLDQLPELLHRMDQFQGLRMTLFAMRFAILTGARSSEFRFARWSEFDLKRAIWTIPPGREAVEGVKHSHRGEKMSRERVIFLSKQTITLLQSMHALSAHAEFVFEGRNRGAPISENSVNKALRDLGYDTQKDICLHGFRTMMVSSLNESGLWSRDAIERHIGHDDTDQVRSAYNHKAQFLSERQRMLQWWADRLDELKEGEIGRAFGKAA